MPAIDLKNPQQLPIIQYAANQTEDTVAVLTDIIKTDSGKKYVYEIGFEVDFLTAYRNNSFTLVTRVCKQLPPNNYRGVGNISLATPEERDWSTVVQIQRIRTQEVATEINNNTFLYSETSNLQESIKSEEFQVLKALAAADKIFEEERVSFKVLKGSDARSAGFAIERHDQDTATSINNLVLGTPNPESDVNELDITQKRQDLVYGFLKDPGEFVQRRAANLLSHKFRLNGLVGGNTYGSEFSDIQQNPIFLSLKKDLQSIVSDGLVQEDELGITQVIETYKTKRYTRSITLDEQVVGSEDFYLVFEVRESSSNQIAQKINVLVPHSENVRYLSVPIESPEVSLLSVQGDYNAVFSIKQRGDKGMYVKIYKCENFSSKAKKNAAFIQLDTVVVSNLGDENVVIWEDPTYTPGIYTIYRFTSLNELELESASFSSIVINDTTIRPYSNAVSELTDKTLQCVLYTKYNRESLGNVFVYVENLPWHVTDFTVYRNNLTNTEEDSFVVASFVNVSTDNTQTKFEFEDTGLITRNFYEYFVEFRSLDGITRQSTTTHKLIYFQAGRDSGVTNLGSPILTNQGGIDVTFEIKTEKNPYEADLIQQALTLQGNKQEFQELLTGNSKRLSPIFQTALYRTNTDSGETVAYGIVDSDLFVDSTFGPKNGIGRPQVGTKYVYTAITHKRDPETLFYDYEKTIVNSIEAQSYSFKPALVLHPERLREGLIVSEVWLERQPFDLFTFGDVVDIDQLEVTIPTIPPEVIDAQARTIARERSLVTWSINGDKDFIDHFMIFMNHNGIDTPVGTCRGFNNDSRYEFVDVLDNGEAGILQYKITPVYYDLSNGKTTTTNKILFF